MKKLVFLLSVIFVTMSSFTTTESSVILEDVPQSCFQSCNTLGSYMRHVNGWTAVQTGGWINDCTASCEVQQ